MLTVEQALAILTRFQSAAPPVAAKKLAEIMDLLRALDFEATSADFHEDGASATAALKSDPDTISVTDILEEIGETPPAPLAPRKLETTPLDYFFEDTSPADLASQWSDSSQTTDQPKPTYAWPKRGAPVEQAQVYPSALSEDSASVPGTDYVELIPQMQDRLQSILTAIRTKSDRLFTGATGHLMPAQGDIMKSIRDQADSALGLIDAMKQIDALQADRFPLHVGVFDCADLVRRARDLMKSTARGRGHQITFQPPDRPAQARADFEQSLAILIDLLDNAIRYTPSTATISMTIDHLGSHILISVVDTGIGLSPTDLANVGKPYWRATHQPVVRENPGSGLRLYLAGQIARLQGGELIFSGELDKGSTFSFTLPAVDESSGEL